KISAWDEKAKCIPAGRGTWPIWSRFARLAARKQGGGNAMAETAAMNGAEWLARALAQTGMSHVFFVESVMRRTLLQLSDLGVKPVLAHSEKAAAYMADGYARVARRPGVCMAQSV